VKQISAIAAFAGLSVEVKEGTSDIIKTPTLTSKDGFSVFEASAIGRYSESYCLAQHEVKRPRLSQIHVNGKTRGGRSVGLSPRCQSCTIYSGQWIQGRRYFVDEFVFACCWVTMTLLTNLIPSRVASS